MATDAMSLSELAAWKKLEAHYRDIRGLHLRDLFAADPARGERLCAQVKGLYLDYSKNRITDQSIRLLVDLAEECGLRGRIDAMFRGDKINVTEGRAVLHVALRAPKGTAILVDGKDVVPHVHAVLDKMARFSVTLILSPRNMASIRARSPDSSASRTSSSIVSEVTRFFE